MNTPPAMNDDVRHLLTSFPEGASGEEPLAILDSLLLRVMVALLPTAGSSGVLSEEEITRGLKEKTQLTFGSGEVRETLNRLRNAGKVEFTDRFEKSIVVDSDVVQVEKERIAERDKLDQAVRNTWTHGFLERYPEFDQVTADRIWMELQAAIAQLVNSRSAEAVAFLYIDQRKARTRFEELLNESRTLSGVLEGPEGISTELFRSEFTRLLLARDEPLTQFLLGALSAAFQYHLISLDPGAARLARSVVGSKVFYLDTNFLFKLLLLGPREAHGPGLIADLASELSTELRVGRATIDEFKSTVRHRSASLRQSLLEREDFRKIAVSHIGNDLDFMAEFYRQQQSGLVMGVNDFRTKCLQIEDALNGWGITIDEECTWDHDILAGLTYRSQDLNAWTSGERTESSCDHDILMEHYVREVRKTHPGNLNDSGVWFLTYDRNFTRFAFRKTVNGEIPVPLLAENWLQIVRCFSPRTQEYDQAFLSLLSSPFLVDDQTVPFALVANALKKLEKYEGLSPKTVAGMVVEGEFVKRLNRNLDEEEERQLVERGCRKGQLATRGGTRGCQGPREGG